MSTPSRKPTLKELDQEKLLFRDADEYLEYLAGMIKNEIINCDNDDDDCDDDEDDYDDDDEKSPSSKTLQFLKDYEEYITSRQQSSSPKLSSNNSASMSSRLRKRFWRYSRIHQTFELISCMNKLPCDPKLDCSVQPSPSFTISLPKDLSINEKLLTNETSPSVILLKSQLQKYSKEKEKNRIVIHPAKCSYDDYIEEKKVAFVVKKSTAAITAPPTSKEQEPIKKGTTIDEKSGIIQVIEKVLSVKKTKETSKNKIYFDFLSNYLAITKAGCSLSQFNTFVWT